MSIAYDDLRARSTPHSGDWLRKSLEVSGVSAAEMAELIDVSTRTMTNYLGGATRPKDRAYKEWAAKTGFPEEFLRSGRFPDESPRPGGGTLLYGPFSGRPAALAQSVEQFTRNDEWQAPVIPLFEPLAA